MELEDHHHQEMRHVCKFCSKRFGCGRSLGGHMRSHMINDTSAMASDGTKLTRKKKLPPLSTYHLISNPTSNNKNCLNTISGPGTPGYVLRENPRQSWKLSDPPPPSDDHNDLDRSCMDSQSDNETTTPGKKKRSKRRRTWYTGPANSSSISFTNNASSSVSEIEQEQEEVAMCLILLSRDVGQWVGSNSPPLDSSDNNSVSLDEGKEPEEENQVETKELVIHEAGEVVPDSCNHLSKRKFIDSFDPEIEPETSKKFKALDGEGGSTKFKCTTCNNVFHSYQALGGHRASHKNTKGCFASKIDSSDNSIETESSPDQTSNSNKLTNKSTTTNEVQADQVLDMDCEDRAETSNGTRKSRTHECAICLGVFPSGQALGGHKRAHLVGTPYDHNHQSKAILDLNFSAPVEEEINGLVGFNPWWLGSNKTVNHCLDRSLTEFCSSPRHHEACGRNL